MKLSEFLPEWFCEVNIPYFGHVGDAPLTGVLGAGTATLGVTYWLVGKWRDRNLPPGPWGLPFIGASFRFTNELHLDCLKMKEKYGDVMSFYEGQTLVVVLSGFKTIQEALSLEEFSDRPIMNKAFVHEYMDELFFCNVSKNKTFKKDRKFATGAMRSFGKGESSLEDKVQRELDKVLRRLNDLNGKPVVFQKLIQQFLSRCITSIVCNTDYEDDDPKVLQFIQCCKDWYDCFLVVPPFLWHYLPTFISQRLFKDYYEMWSRNRSLKEYCIEHMIEHQATFDPDNLRDIIDVYIKTRGPDLDIETLSNTIVLFCPDNVETLGVLLNWSFFWLIHYPHVQKKCQEELVKVVGRGIKPTMAHKKDLPYVEATILECCRMCPVFPLSAAHKLSHDTTFHGYRIPSDNCYIFPNLHSVHNDEKTFPRPEKFDPGHFLDSEGQVTNSEHMVVFSIGRRSCIGEQISRVEIFLCFADLLHNFTFCWPDEYPTPSLDYQTFGGLTGMVMCVPQEDAHMCAVPRQ